MKKILINSEPWQTRVAIIRNSELESLYFAAHDEKALERSFFKGIVVKVLPGIQTAFVDIGQEKAGFLHISEIDRELAIKKASEFTQIDDQERPQTAKLRGILDIKKIFKENEAILVQVGKEPIAEKGAKLTTCFTLPGRFIVLMPNIPRIGISKKIEKKTERLRLKEIVQDYLPENMGAIIRTTSEYRNKKEITKDIDFLVRTWHTIQKKFKEAKPTEKIYEDLPLSLQIVRDHLDDNVEAVIIDNKENQRKIYKFIKLIAPEHAHKVKSYDEPTSLFNFFNIEKQIDAALEKKVPLKSGGSLVIETTEAMTVVDVNTGRFIGKTSLEETLLKTNLEAAEEIVRQLRLRNIGGLIVIDFIDLAEVGNRHRLFNFFEKTLKERDKFQSVVLKISEFGLVQMTRKRSGKTLIQQQTYICQTCQGSGFVKSLPTESYTILHSMKEAFKKQKPASQVILSVNPAIFEHITSIEYDSILYFENKFKIKITLASKKNFALNQYKIEKK